MRIVEHVLRGRAMLLVGMFKALICIASIDAVVSSPALQKQATPAESQCLQRWCQRYSRLRNNLRLSSTPFLHEGFRCKLASRPAVRSWAMWG